MLSRDEQSLEFSMTRFFMKMFSTGSPSIVLSASWRTIVEYSICVELRKAHFRFK